MDSRINHPALAGSIGLAHWSSGALASELSLNAVEMADLEQDPAGQFRSLLQRFQKAASNMTKTSSSF
jgi:hypothetical protein